MKLTLPAILSTPPSFPSWSHRSFTMNPSTSRYHARLLATSFTVKPGAAARILNVSGALRTGRARLDVFFFATFFFATGLFTAIVVPPRKLQIGRAHV